MKIKGGGKKKAPGGSGEVLEPSIHDAIDGSDVQGGDSDCVNNINSNNIPINGSYSMSSHVPETHPEQNLGEGEDDGEGDEEDDDQDGEEGDFVAPSERTNLDEGYFEIEAIRRKRVRKGQLQYLIKWRGWPETDNTWEPLENLQSCSDVIEAFEQSLISGKHRKRKRKHGVVHIQTKRRQQQQQQQSSNYSTYNVTDVEISVVDERLPSAPPKSMSSLTLPYSHTQSTTSVHEAEKNGDANTLDSTKQTDSDYVSKSVIQRADRKKDEHEYDPKLSELKATVLTNVAITDKLPISFQEAKSPEKNGPAGGLSKSGFVEPVSESRCTGAKRRKSGSVKRFRQDPTVSELAIVQSAPLAIAVDSGSRAEQMRIESSEFHGENLNRNNKTDEARNEPGIIKIIKPLGYSASVSNNIHDVLVTFVAMRSDGTEVMVDNKFLKANNPLLLINFYEQHLRYTPRS